MKIKPANANRIRWKTNQIDIIVERCSFWVVLDQSSSKQSSKMKFHFKRIEIHFK